MRASSILAVSLSILVVSASEGATGTTDCTTHTAPYTTTDVDAVGQTPTPTPTEYPDGGDDEYPDEDDDDSSDGGVDEPATTSTGYDTSVEAIGGTSTPTPEEPGYPVETSATVTETVTDYGTHCTAVDSEHTDPVTEVSGTYTYTTVTETECPGECYPPPESTDAEDTPHPGTSLLPISTLDPTPIYDEMPTEYPNSTAPAETTTPAVYDGAATANQATRVGGALAALVGVVVYLL